MERVIAGVCNDVVKLWQVVHIFVLGFGIVRLGGVSQFRVKVMHPAVTMCNLFGGIPFVRETIEPLYKAVGKFPL